jgi:Holliday junction resolvasome RuvABC ATP-dependent DNA helicase subunit
MDNNTTSRNPSLDYLIGQTKLKNQINFYLDSFHATQILPHILFVGAKGAGKTEFSVALARNLRHPLTGGRPKPLLTINSSTLKNVRQFVEDIFIRYVQDQAITLFFDEVHELPVSIQTAFLTVLNPNKKNMNTLRYEDSELVFNFNKVSFVFATTDPQKLLGPFKDRCRVLYMDDYQYSELSEIVKMNLEGLTLDDDVAESVASVCRGNARNAVLTAKDAIFQFMKSRQIDNLSMKEWKELRTILGIMPLGLETAEVNVLKALACYNDGCSLNNLSAKTGYTTSAIQREFESYLVKHNLMSIGQGGRKITTAGREMLKKIEAIQKEQGVIS